MRWMIVTMLGNGFLQVTNEAASESSKKKRRATLTLNENRAELEAIKHVVEKMKDKRYFCRS